MFSRSFTIALTIFLFIILLSDSAFKSFKPDHESIRTKTIEEYKENLYVLYSLAKLLDEKSELFSNDKISLNELQDNLQNVRVAYKKVEFLVEYLDPQFAKDFLNGPPLQKLERNTGYPVVIEPQGLQVLEEVIYSEDQIDKNQLLELTQLLKSKTEALRFNHSEIYISHRQIVEACRIELIRIFSLGVTGFDTPGSGRAMDDALVSLRSMNNVVGAYSLLLKDKDPIINTTFTTTYNAAISYIEKNKDFDKFNRLEFLKKYVNPLYSNFLKVQQALDIETGKEIKGELKPVNYSATNIFANDFINANYYSSIELDENKEDVISLGKLLFFDPVLSANNKRSCASCHNPAKGFTDGMDKSIAMDFTGKINRNSPTLLNAVIADRYFHDMRATRLEDQIEHVMVSEKEFNLSFESAAERLSKSVEYKSNFEKLFEWVKGPAISKETISLALSAYVQSLLSTNSEFDKYVRGEIEHISPEVEKGFNLFMGKAACGTCHFAPTFSGLVPPDYKENESEVLGVPATSGSKNPVLDPDLGRSANKRLTEASEIFNHSFKTPTVRNIKLTGPYMHNGVFKTLEEVMDFYNKGGGAGLGFQLENQTLAPDKLNLNKKEIKAIISFMNALTDTTGITQKPARLPVIEKDPQLDKRIVGGEY